MDRTHHLWSVIAVAVLGMCGGIVLDRVSAGQAVSATAASNNQTVEAEHFVLVNPSGQKRAELGFDAAGNPKLTFYDAHGKLIWSAPGVRLMPVR